MKHEFYMPAEHEAEFYLVDNGIKPAVLTGFGAPMINRPGKPTKEQYIEMYKLYFGRFNFNYVFEKEIGPTRRGGVHIGVKIGSNPENLSRIKNARSDLEIGLALGYPREAIDAFISGTHVSLFDSMLEARKAGVNIPSWLGYVYYCPEKLDLVADQVSQSTKELAERYMQFVQINNPHLAKMVEENLRLQIENSLLPREVLRTMVIPWKASKHTFEFDSDFPFEVRWGSQVPFELGL